MLCIHQGRGIYNLSHGIGKKEWGSSDFIVFKFWFGVMFSWSILLHPLINASCTLVTTNGNWNLIIIGFWVLFLYCLINLRLLLPVWSHFSLFSFSSAPLVVRLNVYFSSDLMDISFNFLPEPGGNFFLHPFFSQVIFGPIIEMTIGNILATSERSGVCPSSIIKKKKFSEFFFNLVF